MEVIAEIRRRHLVSGESISAIARDLKLSRPTVRKHLQTESEAVYLREHQPAPKLGAFRSVLEGWLTTERQLKILVTAIINHQSRTSPTYAASH